MRFLIFIIWFVRKVGGNIFVIFVGNLLCGGNGRGFWWNLVGVVGSGFGGYGGSGLGNFEICL